MAEGQRSTIFDGEAEQYDRFRPGYPSEIIDRLVERRPAVVVDAGCSTGKAATLVAQRGIKVVGVEPDRRMAEIARRHGIDVSVSRLEDWDVVACDVLYAAQAWHWIDPARGAEIASASIRQGGRWAAFWNHETDAHFGDILDGVYRRLAPDLIDEDASTSEDEFRAAIADTLRATNAFDELLVDEVGWTTTTSPSKSSSSASPATVHTDSSSRIMLLQSMQPSDTNSAHRPTSSTWRTPPGSSPPSDDRPARAHGDEDGPVKARRSTDHPQASERLSASRGAVR